jgi:hypothetical protein
LSLHVGQETGAAPLKAQATYSDRHRAFLVKLVSRLVAGGTPLSAEDSRRIAEGVAQVDDALRTWRKRETRRPRGAAPVLRSPCREWAASCRPWQSVRSRALGRAPFLVKVAR